MRFGCCTNMVSANEDGTGIEVIERLKEVGYDYIELPLAQIMELNNKQFYRLHNTVKNSGLKCEACNNFFPASIKLTGDEVNIESILDYTSEALYKAKADPDGWAAGGIYDNANMYFRNTSFYPSFAASSFLHIQQLAEEFGCDVRPLTWAFVFRGERCFEGTRAFQTQGIDKPILNLFRMYALMGDKKLKFESDMAVDVRDYAERCGRGEPPEINGFAALNKNNSIDVLIYCHHDDWWNVKGKAHISLSVENIPYKSSKLCITHYRIDENHSNACTVWEKLGRPHYPSEEQKEQMRAHAGLEMLCLPQEISVENGMVALEFDLPVHGISLIRFECDDLHSIHTPGCS